MRPGTAATKTMANKCVRVQLEELHVTGEFTVHVGRKGAATRPSKSSALVFERS